MQSDSAKLSSSLRSSSGIPDCYVARLLFSDSKLAHMCVSNCEEAILEPKLF